MKSTTKDETAPSSSFISSEFWTMDQLAAELGVTKRTLTWWQTRRIGPPRVTLGKMVLYRKQSVLEWMRSRESKPRSEPRRRRAI